MNLLIFVGVCFLARNVYSNEEDELLDLLGSGSDEALDVLDSMAELEPESLEMPEPESRHVRRRYGSKGGETVKSVQEVKSMTPIKSIEEVKSIQPIKSIQEVKSITPIESIEEIKSMNEIKSMLPVPDEIARRFIAKHGLRSLTSSGGASPYEQEGTEEIARVPPGEDGVDGALGRMIEAIGLLQSAVKALEDSGCVEQINPVNYPPDDDESNEVESAEPYNESEAGYGRGGRDPLIDEIKNSNIESVERVKSMTPIKNIEEIESIEEVKSIQPVKSINEVVAMYELTDEQAAMLRRMNRRAGRSRRRYD